MKTLTAKEFALYLGCEFKYANNDNIYKMAGVQSQSVINELGHFHDCDEVKPILRKLESMTEEEKKKHHDYAKVKSNGMKFRFANESAFRMTWLLSKHFDLFGWIESGLAIDRETLTKEI